MPAVLGLQLHGTIISGEKVLPGVASVEITNAASVSISATVSFKNTCVFHLVNQLQYAWQTCIFFQGISSPLLILRNRIQISNLFIRSSLTSDGDMFGNSQIEYLFTSPVTCSLIVAKWHLNLNYKEQKEKNAVILTCSLLVEFLKFTRRGSRSWRTPGCNIDLDI